MDPRKRNRRRLSLHAQTNCADLHAVARAAGVLLRQPQQTARARPAHELSRGARESDAEPEAPDDARTDADAVGSRAIQRRRTSRAPHAPDAHALCAPARRTARGAAEAGPGLP